MKDGVPIRHENAVLAAVLLFGAVGAIVLWAGRGSLWEDEIIAVTHGLQPFPQFFVEVLRNDIHPFLYFLLVKGWASLNIGSDAWVLASSLVGGFLSAATVAYVTLRVHGRQAALWAAALFCILPMFAWASSNLRMYSLIPAIAIGAWYANREALRTGRRVWMAGTLGLQLVLAYMHAIGFFFAPFFAIAALVEQWKERERRRLLAWGTVQVVAVLAMLPLVGSALVRGTEPLGAPSLASLATYPAQTMSVWGADRDALLLAVGGLAFGFYLIFGLLDRFSRVQLLVIPCGALLTCIVVSSMGKTMFKPPVFTAHLVPFLAMGAAAGIAGSRRFGTRVAALAGAVLMAVALGAWIWDRNGGANYERCATYLVENARPGDVVVVPHVSVFWGVMRYAVAADWGRPLEIMPLQSNEQWTKLKERLGPTWAKQMGLVPARDYVESRGVRYVIGESAEHHSTGATRVWIVHRRNYNETVRLGVPGVREDVTWFGDELSVSRVRPDKDGTDRVSNPSTGMGNPLLRAKVPGT